MIRMGLLRRDRMERSSWLVSLIQVVPESSRRDRRGLKLRGLNDQKSISLDSKAQPVIKYRNFRKFVRARMISWTSLFMVPSFTFPLLIFRCQAIHSRVQRPQTWCKRSYREQFKGITHCRNNKRTNPSPYQRTRKISLRIHTLIRRRLRRPQKSRRSLHPRTTSPTSPDRQIRRDGGTTRLLRRHFL